MRKILSHLKANWIRYGFETVVVTVSIIGAFTLDSWNESRKIREIEGKLLKEMVTGLKSGHNHMVEFNKMIKSDTENLLNLIMEEIRVRNL